MIKNRIVIMPFHGITQKNKASELQLFQIFFIAFLFTMYFDRNFKIFFLKNFLQYIVVMSFLTKILPDSSHKTICSLSPYSLSFSQKKKKKI